MLEQATGLREDVVHGRWLVETWHLGRPWAVIVGPDVELERIVVITAYAVW